MIEKIFIKDYSETNKPQVRTKYGILCSIVGIICNLVLSVAKVIIGLLSGSISILADGIDNFSDLASSVVSLIGFKLAAIPADSEHPFGHERIEYIAGMLISILILILGVLLGRSSIEKIVSKTIINIDNFAILLIILISSIAIKLCLSLYYKKIAKRIDSTSLKASSIDSRNDCIKTFVVLVSIVIFKVFNIDLDGWFGLVVSLYILINGIGLVKDASSPLIGEAPSKDFTQMVIDKIQTYEGVLGIHDLMIHNYGPGKTFITVHVEVDSRDPILESHDMIDNIERDFKENNNILLTIHMDPIETRDELTIELREIVLDVILSIDKNIKFHDFRIVKGITHNNVLFDIVVPQRFKLNDEEISKLIIGSVKEKCEKVTLKRTNVILTIDKDYV